MRPARRQRGSGWLEFGMVAVVLAVLLGFLVRYVEDTRARAERVAVDLTIVNVRSALRWQVFRLLNAGRAQEIARLSGANPVPWLEAPPPVYFGETTLAEGLRLPGGHWFFAADTCELVYLPQVEARDQSPQGGRIHARWQVRALKSAAARDVTATERDMALAETHAWDTGPGR